MTCVSTPLARLFRGCIAVGSFSALAAFAADEKPVTSGPTVELPKFVVTDNRELPKPEEWRYATIPGFEILTNASDKATQRLIKDFTQFRQALSYVWDINQKNQNVTSLILCGKGAKFDSFVPAGRYVPDAGLASIFLKQGTKTAIVIDLQATTLNVLNVDGANDAATGTDSGMISVEHDKQLYREYVKFLLSRNEPRLPAWVEEGLSQVIMKMRFEKRYIEFAKLEDPNTVSAQAGQIAEMNRLIAAEDPDSPQLAGAPAEDLDFNAALRRKALVPLDKFFAIAHDSPEATNVLGNNRWAKQAYALVHMCLYGENKKYQKPFMTFLQRAMREPVTEPMFKECFKMSYKDMLMAIRGYVDMAVYEAQGFQSKKGGPDLIDTPKPIELRDASQSEVGRIKGEAMILAGHKGPGHAEMVTAYRRGEREPHLLAALGLFDNAAGEHEKARKFLEAATAEKVERPEAYLELARYRFADAVAKPEGGEGKFSATQTSAITSLLETGRRQLPYNPAMYELYADTVAKSAVRPTREDGIVMIDAARLYPTRMRLVFQGAVICANAGLLEPAHSLADHGLKYVTEPNARARWEALKKSLPPDPGAGAKDEKAGKAAAPAAPATK